MCTASFEVVARVVTLVTKLTAQTIQANISSIAIKAICTAALPIATAMAMASRVLRTLITAVLTHLP
jgi:hypothetical protein